MSNSECRSNTKRIITLEDLLEEIVGEIYDESDPDIIAVRAQPGGDLVLPGTLRS